MNTEFEKINISEELDSVISKSMGKLRKERRREKLRHAAMGAGGTALALGAAFIFCINNTAFASKIPLIGHVFERMEERSEYPTGLKDNSVRLIDENEAQELDKIIENAESTSGTETAGGDDSRKTTKPAAIKDSRYVKTSNGITIMLSEFTYDKNSIYMGVTIKKDEPFPEGFKHSKYIEGYQLDYDMLGVYATAEFRDENGNKMNEFEEYGMAATPTEVRGTFIDDYTFTGIMAADFSGIKTPEEMPDSFNYNLNIEHIFCDDYLDVHKETGYIPEYGETEYNEYGIVHYKGNWDFDIDISYSSGKITTVNIDEINENGEGIATVSKTPYVINVDPIIPENAEKYDYFCVVCDAQGDMLDYAGNTTESYDVTGKDTDEVYVFLCDANRYLDELKGYFFSDDYVEKRKTKTFAQYLQENCLYGTKVIFD